MKANFRFLRCKDNKTYFARVGLEVLPDGDGVRIEDALPATPDADVGQMNANTAPTWIAAAHDGIRNAINRAGALGFLSGGCYVRLTELVGTPVDTRDDAVRCAAGLAVWAAIGAPEPRPEAEFNGIVWTLRFPATVVHPMTGIGP